MPDILDQAGVTTPVDENTAEFWKKKAEEAEQLRKEAEEKFRQSGSEAIILHHKTKTLQEQLQPKEPSEEELKREFAEWDELTDFEKKLAKRDFMREQEVKQVKTGMTEYTNDRRWLDSVATFIETNVATGKRPLLQGKEEEFKRYCNQSKKKGTDLDILADAFLFSIGAVEAKPDVQTQKALLDNTSAGHDKKPPEPKLMTLAELGELRKTDHKKYQQIVASGKYQRN